MTRQFKARFQNGVVVPEENIDLPEHQSLIFTVETQQEVDPVPEGGTELLDWFSRHRIVLPPEVARDIIENDEYLEQEPEDAP